VLFKIKHSTAVATCPTYTSTGTVGFFRNEDVPNNIEATVVTANWLNGLIKDLEYLAQQTSVTPAENSNTTIYDCIYTLVNTRITQAQGDTRYVNVTGDTMTGLLVLSGDPVVNLGAATKQYVDSTTVGIGGDTMTGRLTLSADPTSALHATTKQYADTKLPIAGGTMTGNLILNTNPTLNLQAATKAYVDTTTVSIDGDVMTGALTLFGNPSANLHAATKQYVDSTTVSISGDTMTGALILSGAPTTDLQAATKKYVDDTTVSISGDTMTGYLTLHHEPTQLMHAATKQYVDTRPKPRVSTLSWTNSIDVATGTYLSVWSDVFTGTVTCTNYTTLGIFKYHGCVHHINNGWSTEFRLLVDGIEVAWTQVNVTTTDNAVSHVIFDVPVAITAGTTTVNVQIQALSHSNRGQLWTNHGQFSSSAGIAGGTSTLNVVWF
jgi:hypothetical protein